MSYFRRKSLDRNSNSFPSIKISHHPTVLTVIRFTSGFPVISGPSTKRCKRVWVSIQRSFGGDRKVLNPSLKTKLVNAFKYYSKFVRPLFWYQNHLHRLILNLCWLENYCTFKLSWDCLSRQFVYIIIKNRQAG